MTISSLSSSYASGAAQFLQRQPEAAEARKSAPDNDRDSDDGSRTTAAPRAAAPAVNLDGQAVGSLLNTTA